MQIKQNKGPQLNWGGLKPRNTGGLKGEVFEIARIPSESARLNTESSTFRCVKKRGERSRPHQKRQRAPFFYGSRKVRALPPSLCPGVPSGKPRRRLLVQQGSRGRVIYVIAYGVAVRANRKFRSRGNSFRNGKGEGVFSWWLVGGGRA